MTSRRVRDRFAPLVIYTALAFSPLTIPAWRLDTEAPPAAVLPVGEPTPAIDRRSHR